MKSSANIRFIINNFVKFFYIFIKFIFNHSHLYSFPQIYILSPFFSFRHESYLAKASLPDPEDQSMMGRFGRVERQVLCSDSWLCGLAKVVLLNSVIASLTGGRHGEETGFPGGYAYATWPHRPKPHDFGALRPHADSQRRRWPCVLQLRPAAPQHAALHALRCQPAQTDRPAHQPTAKPLPVLQRQSIGRPQGGNATVDVVGHSRGAGTLAQRIQHLRRERGGHGRGLRVNGEVELGPRPVLFSWGWDGYRHWSLYPQWTYPTLVHWRRVPLWWNVGNTTLKMHSHSLFLKTTDYVQHKTTQT